MPNKKRIRDIKPVSRSSREPTRSRVLREEFSATGDLERVDIRQTKNSKISAIGKILLLTVVLIAGGVAVVSFFFARADVIVWPQSREVSVKETLRARTAAGDLQTPTISGTLLEGDFEKTKLFSATGKEVKAERATGTIRVFNTFSSEPQSLIQNTRFVAESGKLFRSVERVVVPGGSSSNPGIKDVRVQAVEVGSEYNIEPSSFSIPGLAGTALYTYVYGKSLSQMAGGRVEESTVISQNDLEGAKQTLLEDIKKEAFEQFERMAPPDYLVFADSFALEIGKETMTAKQGDEQDAFTYTLQSSIKTLAVDEQEIRELLLNRLGKQLIDSEQLDEARIRAEYSSSSFSASAEILEFTVQGQGVVYREVDEQSVRANIQGKSKDEAEGIATGSGDIRALEVSVWPFWMGSVPLQSSRVSVEIKRESAP